MTAYYNEHDASAAAWLRELIAAGCIAPGVVDERDIRDVRPSDLAGYAQVHLFAGIGGWSLALRLAGWPDDRPVWTGSCPCQPFSAAGARGGFADERHLWPDFHWLIEQCRPATLFGEQVASKDGLNWFDLVSADLEGSGYAVGAADLCAASVGAPHIRQRLFFVADAHERPCDEGRPLDRGRHSGSDEEPGARPCGSRLPIALADSLGAGLEGRDARALGDECTSPERGGAVGGMADADGWDAGAERKQPGRKHGRKPQNRGAGFWSDLEWLPCRDGKARPTQPGLQPLAHGVQGRVGLLRGAGNAIVPQVAAAFIEATGLLGAPSDHLRLTLFD